VVSEAYRVGAIAVKAGREFLPRRDQHSEAGVWDALEFAMERRGFTAPTLAVPAKPVPMLIRFREFLNANPDREIAALGVTAVAAQQTLATIQAANLAIGRARGIARDAQSRAGRRASKAEEALKRTARRARADPRARATDAGTISVFVRSAGWAPNRRSVEHVSATPAGVDMVIVDWKPAALAESYRVTWRAANRPARRNSRRRRSCGTRSGR
jgi:hypothetical protein